MHLKRMCILLLSDGMLFKYQLSIWSNVLFKTCVSYLIFCLDDLSIDKSGVLKSLLFIVLLLISPFTSVNIALYIEVLLCWVHIYLQLLYLLLGLIP